MKSDVKKLKSALWVLCKKIIRLKYANDDGTWDCYTCGKKITDPSDAHTSHMIPKKVCGAYLAYDLRNLRVTCYFCNIHLGGYGVNFHKNMLVREGYEYVDQIFRDKNIVLKGGLAVRDHYMYLIEKYKLMIEDMS